jgi:hypothetical protein
MWLQTIINTRKHTIKVALSSWIVQLKQHRSSIDVSKNIVVHVNDKLENGTILSVMLVCVCSCVWISLSLSVSVCFKVFFVSFVFSEGARFETTRYVDWLNQSFSPPITAFVSASATEGQHTGMTLLPDSHVPPAAANGGECCFVISAVSLRNWIHSQPRKKWGISLGLSSILNATTCNKNIRLCYLSPFF